jgi:hypothetical protein
MAPKHSFDSYSSIVEQPKNYINNMHAKACNVFFRQGGDDGRCSEGSHQHSDILGDDDDDSSQGNLGPQKRRVRFAVAVKKRVVINRDDYTEEDWENCWYKHKEELKSAKKRGNIVKRMEAGKKETRKMTYRGLESATEKGIKDFDDNVSRCISAVMDEQDDQWHVTLVDDYDRIAAASMEVTSASKERALELGLQDEEEAMTSQDSLGEDNMSTDDDDTVLTDFTPTTKKRLKSRRKQKQLKTERRLDPPGARVSFLRANTLPHLTKIRNAGRQKKRRSFEALKATRGTSCSTNITLIPSDGYSASGTITN